MQNQNQCRESSSIKWKPVMAGAVTTSGIGLWYRVTRHSPRLSKKKKSLNTWHVCLRPKGDKMTEVVAEVKTERMANILIKALRKFNAPSDP